MNKLIITAAICGAEVTKQNNPHVPYTVGEIAEEAEKAYIAGASIIHLHVRDDNGASTQSCKRFRECMEAIKARCDDVIIQPSTGGAVGMSDEERLAPLRLRPEMASLDCGTMNFGAEDIFVNTEKTIRCFAGQMVRQNCKPEIEVFDKGMVDTALRFYHDGLLSFPLHFNFVFGVKGGIGATLRDFAYMAGSLPEGCTYTATGVGKAQFPIAAMAAASGGNIRVGFEDNVYLAKGKLAQSNGDLVAKAVAITKLIGREIATPGEAREILHIKKQGFGGEKL